MSKRNGALSIYVCPALMDWLAFLILFAVFYGAGERRMTTPQCAWLGGIFQITYMVSSLIIGVVLSRRNARAMLLTSTALLTTLGIVCLLLTRFMLLLTALGLLGIFLAVFFNAFQTFMRGESIPGSLTRTVGLYTLAWSFGAAMGVLSSGFLYQFGFIALSGLTALVGIAVLGILVIYKPRPEDELSEEEHVDQSSVRPVNPIYVWIGWLIIFTAMFIQRPLHTFFPSISAQAGISAFLAGLPLFLHMTLQGLVGYGVSQFRRLLYRRTFLWVFHGGAAALFFLIWKWPSFPVCFIGISALGIYAGFAYYAAVFYASNSGRRSFNIGVNECLVGLGSLTGLFISEGWMRHSGTPNTMYLVCGSALLISTMLQLLVASLYQNRPKPKQVKGQNSATLCDQGNTSNIGGNCRSNERPARLARARPGSSARDAATGGENGKGLSAVADPPSAENS